MNWIIYNELAWAENILSATESYEEETMVYIKTIERYIPIQSPTMLHLGCGAGGHDFYFKKHFTVTGVDLSEGMLNLASAKNPEITYVKGDMRTINLNKKFDIVIIPDSIAYMTTLEDLMATMKNAAAHMNPNGVLLVVAHTKEEFRNNNFAYTGEKNNIHITIFENNHIVSESSYEATLTYLIRDESGKRIYNEVHTLGLFTYDQWMDIFNKCQFKVDEMKLNDLYDKNLLEDGEYKLKLFIGTSIFNSEQNWGHIQEKINSR
ncbi:MAG: class I SAM-dependent methyltransferase [Alkaliphilus sp.]|nr:class I SAM-dependent methyltransferase [Alkaliphilus sp.]